MALWISLGRCISFQKNCRWTIRHQNANCSNSPFFPNVIGAIDFTLVAIRTPREDVLYLNRKHFYAVNVQIICDAQKLLTKCSGKTAVLKKICFLPQSSVGQRTRTWLLQRFKGITATACIPGYWLLLLHHREWNKCITIVCITMLTLLHSSSQRKAVVPVWCVGLSGPVLSYTTWHRK